MVRVGRGGASPAWTVGRGARAAERARRARTSTEKRGMTFPHYPARLDDCGAGRSAGEGPRGAPARGLAEATGPRGIQEETLDPRRQRGVVPPWHEGGGDTVLDHGPDGGGARGPDGPPPGPGP